MFGHKKSGGAPEWLVVGLGNPGGKFAGTRHNAGFMAADALAGRLDVRLDRLKFRALTGAAELGGARVLILKPQTYMNLSGESVREAAAYYKIPVEKILVIFDDVSLPLGKLRIRKSGSAGGHNGIKSIIACCGSDQFPRIKIGVGAPPHPEYDMVDWVIGSFTEQERAEVERSVLRAGEAAEELIRSGPDEAMNRFNG